MALGANPSDTRLTWRYGLDASVLDATASGPSAAVTDQVSTAAHRGALAHWTQAHSTAYRALVLAG